MKPTVRKIVQIFIASIVSITLANSAIAEQHLSRSVDDLVWVNGGPGLDFALAWGKRGRAKLARIYHRPINSNFLLKIIGHVPVLLGHFD